MLLRDGAEQTLDLTDLQHSGPSFFAFVAVRIERASGVLFPFYIVVDGGFDDASNTALDAGHDSKKSGLAMNY